MKKIISLFFLLFIFNLGFSQELLATVQVNSQQIEEVTSRLLKHWKKVLGILSIIPAGQGKIQNFEKIKCGFSIVIAERDVNKFKGTIVVQAVRPVYNTTYESPLLNLQDQRFSFEYIENENLIFNERQFSGKTLRCNQFLYLPYFGYDADSFQSMGGTQWFSKAQQIAQTLKTETMMAGIPSMNLEAVPY
jgi:hypothetical protein